MSNNIVKFENKKPLTVQYEKLPPLEKTILQFLSILYVPVSRNNLTLCLNRLNYRDNQGRALNATTLKPTLDALVTSGFLMAEKGTGITCHPSLNEIPSREAVKSGEFEKLVAAIATTFPIREYGGNDRRLFNGESEFIREVRIGIYRQDFDFIEKQFQDYYFYSSSKRISLEAILIEMIDNPFDLDWINSLNTEFFELAVEAKLASSLESLSPMEELFEQFKKRIMETEKIYHGLATKFAEQLMFRGELTELEKAFKQFEKNCPDLHPSNYFFYQGNIAFLKGDYTQAIASYNTALTSIKKLTKKRKVYLPGISGIFFILALIGEGSAVCLAEAKTYLKYAVDLSDNSYLDEVYTTLTYLLEWQQGDRGKLELLLNRCRLNAGEHSLVT
ncbi:MAG: hypothetical protein ACKO4S_05235, partial [Snowella sp.]